MLFKRPHREGIAAGTVDLAFRRWPRARVRPGTKLRTSSGVVAIDAVDVVDEGAITEEDARRAGFASRDELVAELRRHGTDPIHRIELHYAGPDPRVALRERATLDAGERAELDARLGRMDEASASGAWTLPVLELIRDHPATLAAELAAIRGEETQPFKRRVRRLKELGLTESLEKGYCLSPRGRAYLEAVRPEGARYPPRPMSRTDPSKRLEAMPPYMFAELTRRIAEKREAGVDVISLGIGDPDHPTYPHIVEAMQEAVADPSTHTYPSNLGRKEFRTAFATFYDKRFGAEIDPETEVIPAIGAKECIYNLCFAFLDPDDVALAADPGYPVYTGGPVLAGAEAVLMPLVPELGFVPDIDAIDPMAASKARLLFINYPNNPTGAVAPDGFFERIVEFAQEHELLVVHDNAYSETTYDGYVAPSFLATPGAKEVGVEVFSLSKGFNMTGWRCAAILGNADAVATYWRLKTNVDSGLFEAVQLAGAAALTGPREPIEEMNAIYARRRDLVVDALREIGVDVTPSKGTIYVWAPVPEGDSSTTFAERVLEEAEVVVSPGSMYGPSGEGFFRISLTAPDERISEAVERMREHLS
jgi:LL-diaminopimelate aminotransferase